MKTGNIFAVVLACSSFWGACGGGHGEISALPVPESMACGKCADAFIVTDDITAAHLRAFQMYSLARGKDSVSLRVADMSSGRVMNILLPIPDIQPDSILSPEYLSLYREKYEGVNAVHLFVDENGTVSDAGGRIVKIYCPAEYLDSVVMVPGFRRVEVFINVSLDVPAQTYLQLKMSLAQYVLNHMSWDKADTAVFASGPFRLTGDDGGTDKFSVSKAEFYHLGHVR